MSRVTTRTVVASVSPICRWRALAPRSPFDAAVAVVCCAVAVLVLYPLIATVVKQFGEVNAFRAAVADVFRNPDLPTILLNTVAVIGASTLVAIVVATGLAWLNERTDARMGLVTDVLPVVSLLVPSIAGAIGWALLAAPTAGFLNVALRSLGESLGVGMPTLSIFSWPGLIFVYTLYMVPQIYLTVAAALRNIDPALEEAARIAGSGRLRTLRTVTLPVVRPAVLSGALLALVYGIALFSVPLIIGTQARIDVLTVEIVRLLTVGYPPRIEEAIVMSLFLVALVGLLWWVNAHVVRRGNHATIGGRAARPQPIKLGRGWRLDARGGMLLYMAVACVLPVAALALVSLQAFWTGSFNVSLDPKNYEALFAAGSQTFAGLRNSIVLGVVGALIAMALSVVVAHRLSERRGRTFPRVLDGTTKLPGAVSNIVIAVAFVGAFAGPPLGLSGTLVILLLAYIVLYLPQATVSAQAASVQVDRQLLEAARVAGEGKGGTLRRISLPLMVPGLVAGWVFVFALIVGDITASAILASPSSPVVGFVILDLFQNGTYPLMAALATVISLLSSAIVLTTLVLAGGRWRARAR